MYRYRYKKPKIFIVNFSYLKRLAFEESALHQNYA